MATASVDGRLYERPELPAFPPGVGVWNPILFGQPRPMAGCSSFRGSDSSETFTREELRHPLDCATKVSDKRIYGILLIATLAMVGHGPGSALAAGREQTRRGLVVQEPSETDGLRRTRSHASSRRRWASTS